MNHAPELIDIILSSVETEVVGKCYMISWVFHVLSTNKFMFRKYHLQPVEKLVYSRDLKGIKYVHEYINQGKHKYTYYKFIREDILSYHDKFYWKYIAFDCAVYVNDKDIIKYLHQKKWPYIRALGICAYYNNIELLIYLESLGVKQTYLTLSLGAMNGNLNIIKHLTKFADKSHVVRFVGQAVFHGLVYGHLNILKYLHQKYLKDHLYLMYQTKNINNAIYHEHLHILKYLYNLGWDVTICTSFRFVSNNKDIRVANWLLEKGINYDYMVEELAVVNDNLQLIKFLHSKNLLQNKYRILRTAIKNDKLNIIEFMYPLISNDVTTDLLTGPVIRRSKKTVKCLYDLGHRYPAVSYLKAVAYNQGDISMIDYLNVAKHVYDL